MEAQNPRPTCRMCSGVGCSPMIISFKTVEGSGEYNIQRAHVVTATLTAFILTTFVPAVERRAMPPVIADNRERSPR